MLRFLHTSDWQIGKVFRFLDNATMGLPQEARLRVITRIGELGPVDNHLEAMSAATRFQHAA